VVHEVQAAGAERGNRLPVSRPGEADVLGHGGGNTERSGGERACSPTGIDAGTAFGEQAGAEAEREDLIQATTRVPFASESVLGSRIQLASATGGSIPKNT